MVAHFISLGTLLVAPSSRVDSVVIGHCIKTHGSSVHRGNVNPVYRSLAVIDFTYNDTYTNTFIILSPVCVCIYTHTAYYIY